MPVHRRLQQLGVTRAVCELSQMGVIAKQLLEHSYGESDQKETAPDLYEGEGEQYASYCSDDPKADDK